MFDGFDTQIRGDDSFDFGEAGAVNSCLISRVGAGAAVVSNTLDAASYRPGSVLPGVKTQLTAKGEGRGVGGRSEFHG